MSESLDQLFDSCTTGYYDYLLLQRERWLNNLLALKRENISENDSLDGSDNMTVVNSYKEVPPVNTPPTPLPSTGSRKMACSVGTKVKMEKNVYLKCDVENCRFFCYSPTVMNAHMHIHDSIGVFECDYMDCHKTFKTKNQLNYHKAQHEGREMFRCPYYDCDYCCANSKYLEVHKRVHTGDNPYACKYPGCKAVFRQKSLLRQHERKHDLSKLLLCNYKHCDFVCKTQTKMDKHIEEVHRKN